nr:MAG TPA: hypothetical protein [Caudoviricetes sp.]
MRPRACSLGVANISSTLYFMALLPGRYPSDLVLSTIIG